MSKKIMFNNVETHIKAFQSRLAEIADIVIATPSRVKVHSFEYSSLPAREILRLSLHVKPMDGKTFSDGALAAFAEFAVPAFERHFNGTGGVSDYDRQNECRVSATNYGEFDHGVRSPNTFGGSILFAVTMEVFETFEPETYEGAPF